MGNSIIIAFIGGIIGMLLGGLGFVGGLVVAGGTYLIVSTYQNWQDGQLDYYARFYNLVHMSVSKDSTPIVFCALLIGKILAGLLIISVGMFEPWNLPTQ